MAKTEIIERAYKVSDTRSSVFKRGEEPHEYFDGIVRTPVGLVECASYPGDKPLTYYAFQHNGVVHYRYERGRARTRRGLAIMAHKFAREVAARCL